MYGVQPGEFGLGATCNGLFIESTETIMTPVSRPAAGDLHATRLLRSGSNIKSCPYQTSSAKESRTRQVGCSLSGISAAVRTALPLRQEGTTLTSRHGEWTGKKSVANSRIHENHPPSPHLYVSLKWCTYVWQIIPQNIALLSPSKKPHATPSTSAFRSQIFGRILEVAEYEHHTDTRISGIQEPHAKRCWKSSTSCWNIPTNACKGRPILMVKGKDDYLAMHAEPSE